MFRFTRVLGLVAVTLGLATTAAAAPPISFEIDDSIPDSTCPGIDLTFRLTGTVRIITQKSGQEIQVFPHFRVSYSGNGRTLSSAGPAVLHITYNADGSIAQTKVTGLLAAYTVPGHGVILLDAGHIVLGGAFPFAPVIEWHGPFDFFVEGDVEAFCAYFAGTL
jgi:hypothetical protein